MKKRLLMLLSLFMAVTSVGWVHAQSAMESAVLNVDAARTAADTGTDFKTLKAAVEAANKLDENKTVVINVKPGAYDIARDNKTTGNGNYLAITHNNLEIIGAGEHPSEVKIYSTNESVNGNWVDQNLITIHGNNVKIKNAIITCKHEVNKVIEVLGENVALEDLIIIAPNDEGFAGSIYFNSPENDADKNIGTVTLSNLDLQNARITFSGAEKGAVTMDKVQIYYKGVKTNANGMGDIQAYSPIGAIAGKPDLKFRLIQSLNYNGLSVTVSPTKEGQYNLDAATVANLPAGAHLGLMAGTYLLDSQLILDKSINISGVYEDPTATILTPSTKWKAKEDKSRYNNLISIEGASEGDVLISRLLVKGSKASGINAQSKMSTNLLKVTLTGNTNAGLLVHSSVSAEGLITKDNVWGGVNVGTDGSPVYSPKFTFSPDCSFAESSKIWSEDTKTDPDKLVEGPNGWISYVGVQGASNEEKRYWTNSTTMNVANANELKTAISVVKDGGVIVLTGTEYGTESNIQSFGAINVPNVTIKADAELKNKPKLYGTIQIMADGCTVEGLEFHTKGGSHPFKNAIDVVAMSVTIKNNDFIMTTPASGSVGNGITIWPVGEAATASYIVTGNSFNGFTGTAGIWNSTAFQIADKCSLNEHFSDRQDISKEVQIANEQNYWTDNKFSNCDADYVHATWPSNAAVYSFVALSQSENNVSVLKEAVSKAAANAQIFVAGTYELDAKLLISKPLSLTGVISEEGTTTFTVKNDLNDHLIAVERVNGTVSLSNLAIKKSQGYGLHLFNSKDVKLTSIGLSENKKGGLLVNGSTVTADKLTTEGNAWGGIEVAKGVGVTTDPKLTISNSTIKEKSQIWADTDPSVEGSAEIAKWVAGTGWNMFVEQPSGKDYKQTFWSQKIKIQINITKSTFFYDEKQPGNKYTVQYTTTPADVKGITVKYYDIVNGKPNGEGTTDGKSTIGSYYAIFTRDADKTYLALNDTVTMSINAKGVPSVSTKPTYTTVEAGQPLSMSLLEGGKAIVKVEGNNDKEVMGTFAWADANMILKEGEHNYAVVFTPANLAEMEVAIDSVKIDAERYFTVTTGVSANGKATITGKSASNRYVNGTELDFVITPETGYAFTGWNGTNNMVTKYKVEKDTSFVAGFEKKKFTVTIESVENGSIEVKADNQEFDPRKLYPYGTILTVTAKADGNYTADAITTTGSAIAKGQIFLDANTTISATFKEKPQNPQQVNVKASEGGTVRLTNEADGKEIVAGSYVTQGTTIIVERTPNKGYKLKDISQARTSETVNNTGLTIESSFEKEVYTIKQETGDGYTLTVDKTEGNYGDQVTVGYAVNAGYKAVALMVNAKEVPNNSTFTLTENTTVQAIVKEKATIAVNNEVKQSYVYNGHNQPFVVKTTPAGLDSVSVSYTKGGTTVSTPVDAGTYTVHISRPEDENFKALNATATLKITPAPIVIMARPSAADGTGGAASVAGEWSAGNKPTDVVQPMTKALKSTTYALFTPTSSNYSVGYCTPGDQMNMKVTIEQPTNGTITVWDGNLQIDGSASSNDNALKNTELRVIATPAEGYKFSAWTSGITSNKNDASATITSSEDITFTATFVEKVTLSPSITKNASAEYDGTAKGGDLKITANTSVTTGWSYSFQQNKMTVVPVNAGKYDVVVTRAADADYKACRVVLTNAFEIERATPSITTKPAATLAKGAMLHSAEVTGGVASTDGTFVWESADEAINADATDKVMTFVPSDKDNFKEVKVTGVEVKTTNLQVISFVQPENGTIIVKRGETVLASGDPIANGDKLIITATAASGYELESLKVADGAFTNGDTYNVEGDVTVNVVATMKKTQSGGGDPVVPVSVSSVSLDKSALTLPRLDSYTLIATVNPSNATNKSVTWKSSDESIAKVDANGKVTAVKIGKATITVTTVDGNKTATCLVTVDFATGIEEMLAQTEVYSQQGNIIVNPVQPLQLTIVNMTGQTVYNDYISGSTQIPARSGVYIVKLSNAGNTIISKLIVR